jgi:hypothetical protein
LIPSPEYELNSNPNVTVIFASSVGNASRHNDESSISADLDRANIQGHGERNDRGNDVANEDGNDRGNKNGKDNTEDIGDTNHGDDTNTTILGTSIDLVKKNRPLLDRLGNFGKVLEKALEIGTAVSEVNLHLYRT